MPCKLTSYEVIIKKYHINSWVVLDNPPVEDISQKGVQMKLVYETLTVEERIETLVYDTGSFLSAIGGNLGLLLGFSCFTMMLGILKVAKLFQRKLYLTSK